MSVIQITLDYLDELKELDPEVRVSVTVYSRTLKAEERVAYSEPVIISEGVAWTRDSDALSVAVLPEAQSTSRKPSSDA